MNRFEFLSQLSDKLRDLSPQDRRRVTDYYSEMIDDRIEEGLSEEEAVQSIGDPEGDALEMLSAMGIHAAEETGSDQKIVSLVKKPEAPEEASEPQQEPEKNIIEETAEQELRESGNLASEKDYGVSDQAIEEVLARVNQGQEAEEEDTVRPPARKRRIWPAIAATVILTAVAILSLVVVKRSLNMALDFLPFFGHSQTRTNTIDGEISKLIVETSSGDVRFEYSESENTKVKVSRRYDVSYDVSSRTLRVEKNGADWLSFGMLFGIFFSGDSDVVIELPAGQHPWGYYEMDEVDIRTSSGEIKLPSYLKVNQKLNLKTSSGDIQSDAILAVSSGLIETSSGDIRCTNHLTISSNSESFEFGSSSGKITLESVSADQLYVHSSSGKIRIRNAFTGDFTIRSSSGEVYYSEDEKSEVHLDRFSVETTSGDVEMRLREIPIIQTRTTSGKVTISPSYYTEGEFSITTTSGDIKVQRY